MKLIPNSLFRYCILLLFLILLITGDSLPAISEENIEHMVDIHLIGIRLVAVRSGSPNVDIEMHLNEKCIWMKSFGRLGAVLTTDRFLVVTQSSGSWFEMDLRLEDGVQKEGHFSSDLVFYDTGARVIGFDRRTNSFIEWDYAISEMVLEIAVGESIAGIVSNNNVVGYTAGSGGHVVLALRLSERPLSISAKTDMITVVTSLNLLTFQRGALEWSKEPIR
jgi:hypothetical protein